MKKNTRPEIWYITLNNIFQSSGQGIAIINRLRALQKNFIIHLFVPYQPGHRKLKNTLFSSIYFHGVTDSIKDILKISWFYRYFKLILRIANRIPNDSKIYTDNFLIPLSKYFTGKQHRIILDYHGIYYKQLIEKGYRKIPLITTIIKAVEHHSLKLCSKIICVDKAILEYLKEEVDIISSKLVYIPNGVDLAHFNKNVDPTNLRKQLDITENEHILFFSGSFRPWHGLDNLIDVLVILHSTNEKIKTVFVGDGPERMRIQQRCKNELPNKSTLFTGHIDYKDMPKYTALADICLYFPDISTKDSRGFYGDPLKFYEWMAMAKPIITIDSPDLVQRFGNDPPLILTKPDKNLFAQKVKEILHKEKNILQIGEQAYEFVKNNYSWNNTAQKIKNVLIE